MAYVVTENCTKDALCVDACPVDCIHPRTDEPDFDGADQMFINPEECTDCGACIPVCPVSAIYAQEDVPSEQAAYIDKNRAYYAR